MRRIHARAIAAQMIERHAFWNHRASAFEVIAMRELRLAAALHERVSRARMHVSQPDPTRRLISRGTLGVAGMLLQLVVVAVNEPPVLSALRAARGFAHQRCVTTATALTDAVWNLVVHGNYAK